MNKAFVRSAFLLVLVAVAVSSHSKVEMEEMARGCMTQHKVSPKVLIDAYGKSSNPDDVSDEFKCAIECYFKKLGLYESDKFSVKKAEEAFPKVADIVEKCAAEEGKDSCDTAFLIVNCLWEENAAGLA